MSVDWEKEIMFSPFPSMNTGGNMAMVVSKPKVNQAYKVAQAVKKAGEPEYTPDNIHDFIRAHRFKQYNNDRTKDDADYEAWKAAYASFNDGQAPHRVIRRYVAKKGEYHLHRTHVNRVVATFLKDGDWWGNPESPTKAEYLKRSEESEKSPLKLAPVKIAEWKPRIVTVGFEDYGRPPTVEFVLKHGVGTSPTPLDDFSPRKGETKLEVDVPALRDQISRLEAHLEAGNEVSFYNKLSIKAGKPFEYWDFISKKVHIGETPQSKWKSYWRCKRIRNDVEFIPYIERVTTGNELTKYINPHQSVNKPDQKVVLDQRSPDSKVSKKKVTFSEEVLLSSNTEYVESSNYLLDELSFLRGLHSKAKSKGHNGKLLIDVIKFYQFQYACSYEPFSNISNAIKHVWKSYQQYKRNIKRSGHLIPNYATRVEPQKSVDNVAKVSAASNDDNYYSIFNLRGNDKYCADREISYLMWLRRHDSRNKWCLATREEVGRKLGFLRRLNARMFFESLPNVCSQLEMFHSKKLYNSLPDDSRYEYYWQFIAKRNNEESNYQDWLLKNCDARNQVVDLIQDFKSTEVKHKTPEKEVVKSNNLLLGFNPEFIDKEFSRDPRTGLVLPTLNTTQGLELCTKTGLILPIGMAQLDYVQQRRQKSWFEKSWFEKSKEFFTGSQ
jgi:hypothetical protein